MLKIWLKFTEINSFMEEQMSFENSVSISQTHFRMTKQEHEWEQAADQQLLAIHSENSEIIKKYSTELISMHITDSKIIYFAIDIYYVDHC